MSRLEWILTALMAVLLVAVVSLGALVLLRPRLDVPPPLPTVDAPVAPTPELARDTALLAYSIARDTAREQREDARLVKASATWTQGTSREDLLSGMATWSFTFYSPSSQMMSIISVIEDEANLLRERSVEAEPDLQDASGWRIDSPDAVALTLEEGGDRFLDSAGTTTMTASLTTNAGGRIEWFVSLFSNYSGKSFTVRLDATSGDVLSVEEAS